MDKQQLIEKITEKKEFSNLPKKDVELIFEKFNQPRYLNQEKIKLTRDLLRKVFSAFISQKLLSPKNKEAEWILKKHLSTKERFPFYKEVYEKIFKDSKNVTVFDLGAGINGFSYKLFPIKIKYIAIEAVGQLVNLMNNYFQKEKIKAKAIHESLFELEKIKKLIKKEKGEKIIFLFKTLDSLEMIERDYSKKLLSEIVPLGNKTVVSFATRSLISKKRFHAKRDWIVKFISDNFTILEDFEIGGERYVILKIKSCK